MPGRNFCGQQGILPQAKSNIATQKPLPLPKTNQAVSSMIADHISFCKDSFTSQDLTPYDFDTSKFMTQRGCDICSSPSKASIKGTVLESRLLPGNFHQFPGYFRRFPGYFRLFPGYFCLFPQKHRHIYDMMVARFAGGGGNLSAASCFSHCGDRSRQKCPM